MLTLRLQNSSQQGCMSPTPLSYRAVHAVGPGKLELTDKPLLDPPPGQVRIRVQACGVCHTDAVTVEGVVPIAWPRVPGHEVVGKIDKVGDGVEGWAVGQRVGVGFLGGSCGRCEFCRGGDLVNCRQQEFTGVQHDGGYAEVLIAKASGPDVDPGRSVVGRCGALALRRPHDFQRAAKFARQGR
jgi:propanol-preferring alcohol dehydrogenase